MNILQRNLNRHTFVVWEMKRNMSVVRLIVMARSSGPPASRFVSCLTRLSADLSVIWLRCGNLQNICKSIGRWGTLNWIFPAGWSDIPHFARQNGQNSVHYRRPRYFEGILANALARSDGAWSFLMGISEREILPKQTTNHRRLESKHHRRNSDSDSGRTGKDFPKYGALGSILSGRKWWPLIAHIMMSSHFLHNELSPLQITLQYLHLW